MKYLYIRTVDNKTIIKVYTQLISPNQAHYYQVTLDTETRNNQPSKADS